MTRSLIAPYPVCDPVPIQISADSYLAVANLEDSRPEAHGLDAIYLLTPRPDVFERLIADLQRRKYPACSLIWTSSTLHCAHVCTLLMFVTVPPEAYRQTLVNREEFKSQIKTYKVLNVEYFPQESHLVTFRDPWEATYLFHPLCMGIIQKHVEDMAQKVCRFSSQDRHTDAFRSLVCVLH